MEDVKAQGLIFQSTYMPLSDGNYAPLRLNRRGELVTVPLPLQLSLDGRVFVANVGTASTPVNFAETAYDADQPQFVIDVPSGKTALPLNIKVVLETSAGTLNEIIVGSAAALVGAGTSTAVTAKNLTATQPNASGCTVRSLYTGDGTDITALASYVEWARGAQPIVGTAENHPEWEWNALKAGFMPVLVGPASLAVWILGASTAPTGYLTAVWAELDSAQA